MFGKRSDPATPTDCTILRRRYVSKKPLRIDCDCDRLIRTPTLSCALWTARWTWCPTCSARASSCMESVAVSVSVGNKVMVSVGRTVEVAVLLAVLTVADHDSRDWETERLLIVVEMVGVFDFVPVVE